MTDFKCRFVTPEQAVRLAVKDGDWVDYGFGAGFPDLLDKALAERKGEIRDVKIRGGLVILRSVPVLYRQYIRTDVAFVPVSAP